MAISMEVLKNKCPCLAGDNIKIYREVKMRTLSLTLLILYLSMNTSYAEIFKWVDENGDVHFSDKKPETAAADQVALKINTYTQVSIDNSIFDVGPEVVMYSTEWCGFCKKARKYFRDNNIAFTDYDIEKNLAAKQRYDQMGATGVPVILVEDKRMNGFNVEGFKRIYQ
ncbi:glutaredoxin family protein [Methylophaga sp. OBS4]|uniref:glutaredoxin family protein n=1 Tax=Methylophaga sp. OBS4 TaxID=2991935 RepID=UPI002259EB07|nr:glutaredoxin family protein [Methylophaga sp. OBS4]MCX4186314.1 glutaredoxin family protein [Methylophaga sp. OBS4]